MNCIIILTQVEILNSSETHNHWNKTVSQISNFSTPQEVVGFLYVATLTNQKLATYKYFVLEPHTCKEQIDNFD